MTFSPFILVTTCGKHISFFHIRFPFLRNSGVVQCCTDPCSLRGKKEWGRNRKGWSACTRTAVGAGREISQRLRSLGLLFQVPQITWISCNRESAFQVKWFSFYLNRFNHIGPNPQVVPILISPSRFTEPPRSEATLAVGFRAPSIPHNRVGAGSEEESYCN